MTKKVTELPAATTPLDGADILLVVQGGVSKQSPVSGLPASGGSLTNWTEAVSTAAPNATVPVTSFTATNAATNVDAALRPKGTGALLAEVPDNASAGGNKRGANAVDWQTMRSGAGQVASGSFSVIGGGSDNTASGSLSVTAGGSGNSASATTAVAAGGSSNTASGPTSTVSGGESNTASGAHSYIPGGRNATTRSLTGAQAVSSGLFSVQGDAQRERFVMRRSTTNATPSVLSTDGAGAASDNQAVLPNNSAYAFKGNLIARNAANGDCSHWEFKGTIRRGANAAATALVAAVTPTVVSQDAGASTWAVAITADTTRGCISITVTGVAATNIKWVADVETVEVVG